ncbi:MAG: TRAP transporter small permease [Sphaerochaeta sp.]|uniref:TRAP transporter small permease n=1 Tax=Sphaerochaeta sp. TaxID=1972642 RepID=UPI001D8C60C6|nr:TRAP transporter small permease [uncultured Sphaerochaeta sp.]MDD3057191.1 TRAP transporter small permease [Sphaerochaeta sp.]MDD3928946.1 TRAP transporter small permease [Sphaerochaeta sp.]NCC12277.1 TRAP transporter small permease [Spirochaetia bacterium]NCC89349.1 TRAP transporter small permease [Spirochaetia bacterium]
MPQALKKVLSNFELILASTCIIVTTSLVMLNVILRYFFRTGLYWSEEVATACFVWSVFIGAAAGYKHKAHVGVDMLVNLCPPTLKKIVTIVVDLILLLINGYITYIAVIYLSLSYKKPTPVLGISTAYISSSILVSFALMTIYAVYFLIQDIRTPKEGGAAC